MTKKTYEGGQWLPQPREKIFRALIDDLKKEIEEDLDFWTSQKMPHRWTEDSASLINILHSLACELGLTEIFNGDTLIIDRCDELERERREQDNF